MQVPLFSQTLTPTGSHHLVSCFALDAEGRAGQLSQKQLESAYLRAKTAGTDHQLALIDRQGYAVADSENVIRFNSRADALDFFARRLAPAEPATLTFNIENTVPMVIATKDWPIVANHTATPVGTDSKIVFTIRQCQTGPEEQRGQYLIYVCPDPYGDIPVPETLLADRCRELCLTETLKKCVKRWSCRASEVQKLLNAMPPVPVVEKPLWQPLELPAGMMEQIVERVTGEVWERLMREITLSRAAGGGLFDPTTRNVKGTMTGRYTSTQPNYEEVPREKPQPLIARRKVEAFLLLDAPEVRSLSLDKLLAAIKDIVSLLHQYRTEPDVASLTSEHLQAVQMIVDLDEVKSQLNQLAEQQSKAIAGAGGSELLLQTYHKLENVLREFVILQMPTISSLLQLA